MPILIIFILGVCGAWWLESHCRWFYEVLVWAGGIGFVVVITRDLLRLLWAIFRIPILGIRTLVSRPRRVPHSMKPVVGTVPVSVKSEPVGLCPPKHPEWN